MATGILERTKQNTSLRAYGKLSGGTQPADFTEDQKAFDFNSKISENYQKLINPEFRSAEDFSDASYQPAPEPVYATQEEYAMATLYPGREMPAQAAQQTVASQPQQTIETPVQQAPVFEHHRVTSDIFRADSSMNAAQSAPVYEPTQTYAEEPSYAPYAEESNNADITPSATTIQYRSDLFRDEKQEVVEEKKSRLTAKGKLLMAIYAIVVVVVLALIIVNTSVLKTLDNEMAAQEARLNAVIGRYETLQNDVDNATSEETIREWGEAHGMYLPD